MTFEPYPQMLFHVVLEPVVAADEKEESEWTAKGYSRHAPVVTEENLIKAKIAYHQSEVERLLDILGELEPEKIEGTTEEERFLCNECDFEAKSMAGLSAHKRSHKEDSNGA